MPKDLDSAAQLCYGALSNPNTRPTILMVDAVNQVFITSAIINFPWLGVVSSVWKDLTMILCI